MLYLGVKNASSPKIYFLQTLAYNSKLINAHYAWFSQIGSHIYIYMTMVYDDMAYIYLYAVWTVCPQLVDIAYACLRQGCHSPRIFDTHNQE